MFGYVTPLKDELKVRELSTFKSYYCGLCHHIKKGYGNLPRLSLNYDMTFLGLLLDSLTDDKLHFKMKVCLTNPVKKKPMVLENAALSYAAAMNVALVYYKLLDDVADDKSLKSKLLSQALKPYTKKFPSHVKPILQSIERNLNLLCNLETKKDFSSIDEICHPFSLIVGDIFSHYASSLPDATDSLERELFDFGYALGKWIYMIDALDDLKKDMEKGKFNPLHFLYNERNLPYDEFLAQILDRVAFTILNCGYNCKTTLEQLPLYKNKELLMNIVSLGMMDQYVKITEPCDSNCKGRSVSSHEDF